MKFLKGLFAVCLAVIILSACGGSSEKDDAGQKGNGGGQEKEQATFDVSNAGWMVDDFNFKDENGKDFGLKDLKGHVWLADFIFTHCQSVCPPMTAEMAKLQKQLNDAGVDYDIVSFSVDPERDDAATLKAFGKQYHADFSNWHFLSGYQFEDIQNLAAKSFKTSVTKPQENSDQFTHGTSFFLVDKNGRIVKRYHGYSDVPADQIIKDVKTYAEKPAGKMMSESDMEKMGNDTFAPLKVDIQTEGSLKAGASNEIKIKVTKKDQPVAKADEVMFEIWKDGDKDNSQMVKADNVGNGFYSIHHTFAETGTYKVTAHVTALDSHTMPTKTFHVK